MKILENSIEDIKTLVSTIRFLNASQFTKVATLTIRVLNLNTNESLMNRTNKV